MNRALVCPSTFGSSLYVILVLSCLSPVCETGPEQFRQTTDRPNLRAREYLPGTTALRVTRPCFKASSLCPERLCIRDSLVHGR